MTAVTPLVELNALIAEATSLAGGEHDCFVLGHRWKFVGGRSCGCEDRGGCSVPVYRCEGCGDYDYGNNQEADEVRRLCERPRDDG